MKGQRHLITRKAKILFLFLNLVIFFPVFAQNKVSQPLVNIASVKGESKNEYRDLYADTWVATDGIGRTMPGIKLAVPLKKISKGLLEYFISPGIQKTMLI